MIVKRIQIEVIFCAELTMGSITQDDQHMTPHQERVNCLCMCSTLRTMLANTIFSVDWPVMI
jgi:hypothetical protein